MILVISMLLIALCLLPLARGYHTLNKQQKETAAELFMLRRHFKQVQQENTALVHADLNFGKQLREFTQQLISIENQIQNMENHRTNDGGYQHALRILAMGGDKQEIINSCHLSNAEAELMINLHSYQTAISSSSLKRESV